MNKSRQSSSDFVTFITVPQVPRKRPDMTTLIHRPLQHFREVLKLIILLASHCRPHSEECKNFTVVITALQTSYREITVNEGIMEPHGEGRPLLTLQDLEARLVFTKCKPFVLSIPGRQWIFGKFAADMLFLVYSSTDNNTTVFCLLIFEFKLVTESKFNSIW